MSVTQQKGGFGLPFLIVMLVTMYSAVTGYNHNLTEPMPGLRLIHSYPFFDSRTRMFSVLLINYNHIGLFVSAMS